MSTNPPSPAPGFSSRASLLLQTTHSLCTLFSHSSPPSRIRELFTPSPTITEHGPPLLPFLRTFSGPSAVSDYLGILSEHLSLSSVQYGQPTIDKDKETVTISAHARFTWLSPPGTGTSWTEDFLYMLSEFDPRGRVGRWDVWADPLSAWLASRGKTVQSVLDSSEEGI
ncbi:hypothetical protein DACRYDRAFT_45207 [Dacryopinax primogenitus]|uniref:SnoaL-like domain-containing protein n=1 Tax=Dacryopinax primogenitus (strain DJM 731) TaxID=1858805 RepID=M5GCZ2_DACPD|nr:uncharacterized protein DACRYDRAFT_45207 [Dacryopinax primogenitus]EJU06515.1 hypothetical protein DACRYDRAFT_45207 [Dacryopinax primogenitus]